MSSTEMMTLVRELKSLNKRKKAGEVLSDAEKERRRALKKVLRAQLEAQKSQEGQPVSPSLVSEAAQPPVRSTEGHRVATAPVEIDTSPPSSGERRDSQEFARIAVQRKSQKKEPVRVEPAKPGRPGLTADDKERYKKNLMISAPVLDEVNQAAAASAPAQSPRKRTGVPKPTANVLDIKFEPKHNEKKQIREMYHLADEALAAQQTRDRVTEPEQVEEQLLQIDSGYTSLEADATDDEYYNAYLDDGYGYASVAPEELNVIDPREIELHKVGLAVTGEDGATNVVIPHGLAFLDDFYALYENRVLPPPSEEVEADEDDPNLLVRGRRRVTVHMLDGRVKRGAIAKLSRGALGFTLLPTGAGRSEDISMGQVKAVFVHKPAKAEPAGAAGRSLTVTFSDRRSVMGSTDDYQPGEQVFSLIPSGTMAAQYERIVINAGAVAGIR